MNVWRIERGNVSATWIVQERVEQGRPVLGRVIVVPPCVMYCSNIRNPAIATGRCGSSPKVNSHVTDSFERLQLCVFDPVGEVFCFRVVHRTCLKPISQCEDYTSERTLEEKIITIEGPVQDQDGQCRRNRRQSLSDVVACDLGQVHDAGQRKQGPLC